MVVCRKAYHKRYYAKNREQILARQKRYRTKNAEILKSRRKSWYENNSESSSAAREPIVKRTRRPSEITEHNTVVVTMLRIRNRSAKDFLTKKAAK